MQILDEQKREKILAAAAGMFASQPFHKVLLSDVAEAAAVGKGTIYIYFKNKQDLYLAVLYHGFERLLTHLQRRIVMDAGNVLENLETVIREYVNFAYQSPSLFELMRSGSVDDSERVRWKQKREELSNLIESLIRHGIMAGQFEDPRPELTAKFIPGLVRLAFLGDSENPDRQILTEHVIRFIRKGLDRKDAQPA